MKRSNWVSILNWSLVVGGVAFLALLTPNLFKAARETREKVQAYDALMKQVAGGAPPDAILATAYDKLNRGMTEDEVRKTVEECVKNWTVNSSRTTTPGGKEGEVRLIWYRIGEFTQKDHSCEEINVDLGADGLVKAGGVTYVGNYTLDGKDKPQLWKQK